MSEEHGILEIAAEFEQLATDRASLDGSNVIPLERAERALRQRENRFRALLDALPAAVYTTDAIGNITFYNEAAVDLWGHRPLLGNSTWCGSWRIYLPDGTPLPHDECPMAVALKENRAIRGVEAVAERPDGSRVPFLPFPTPLHDETGRLTGAVNMLVDLSFRKQAEDHKSLLIRELQHRVKNTLATVQAVLSSTVRHTNSVEEFQESFTARIMSLAKTHTILTDTIFQTGSLHELLTSELGPFDDGTGTRVRLNGPATQLPSEIVVRLGMALHELTTNATKYGAFSAAEGSVEVTWAIEGAGEARTLLFTWVEQGGPPVKESERKGFGSRLIQQVLMPHLNAEMAMEFRREGLRVKGVIPLSAS